MAPDSLTRAIGMRPDTMQPKNRIAGTSEPPAALGGEPSFPRPLPFVRPQLPPADELLPQLREMLLDGRLTKGPCLETFEAAVAEHLGVKHAVAVSSCTIGLMLAYQSLQLRGEAIVPSFTFMATVSSLVWAGVKPVFVDIDPETATVDALAVERAITPRTTAIVAVHTFGNPAEIEQLESIAARHGVPLVFDAAHGFGALYRGQPVGAQGDVQVFSLSPTKLLVAGEGGIVATNRDDVAQSVRLGREYGNDGSYNSAFAGLNGRMGEFNALLGLHGLSLLEQVACRRNVLANLYRELLVELPGLTTARVNPGNRCSFKDMSIVVDPEQFGLDRDQLALALLAEGIDTRKYFDPPVHRHTAYANHALGVSLPATEWLAARSISLPIGTHLDESSVRKVCEAIGRIHRHAIEIKRRFAAGDRVDLSARFAEAAPVNQLP